MHLRWLGLLLSGVLMMTACGGEGGATPEAQALADASSPPTPDAEPPTGGDARSPSGRDTSVRPTDADAPDAAGPGPDASGSGRDAAAGSPDAAVTRPDAAVTRPDAVVLEPDATPCAPTNCAALGLTCGVADDGCGRGLDCGPCPPPDAAPPQPDAAVSPPDATVVQPDATPCAPTNCDALGLTCGVADDGCGRGLDCGPCPPPTPRDPFDLDPHRPASLADLARAVYSGPDAVQTGVEPDALRPETLAWLRGRVVERDAGPLAGVTVRVFGRPALGRATTRADGTFDLVVDGPLQHRLIFEHDDFLPAERAVSVRRGESRVLDDVALLDLSAHPANPLALGPGTPWQVAAGALESDADGPRRATLLIPPETDARLVFDDGIEAPVDALTLRLAEYTVGANGPSAMPAELPPASGYTYAVEIAADEALQAGARSIALDAPAWLYVENFVGFPVGGVVPAGYYERTLGAWLPSDDGHIIAVLGIEGALAQIDVDGSGLPADAARRAALGLTDGERALLAERYAPGTSLWRVPVTHFTPWDCNWPYGPPEDAEWPPADILDEEGLASADPDCDRLVHGSIVHCQTGALTKVLGLPGTPFELVHRGDRAPGYRAPRRLDLHLGDGRDPASLLRVEVTVDVAGRRLGDVYPPGTRRAIVEWDGRDAFGRPVPGPVDATVRIRRVYPAVYLEPGNWNRAFGRLGTTPIEGSRERSEIMLDRSAVTRLGALRAGAADLGGFEIAGLFTRGTDGRVIGAGVGGAGGFVPLPLLTLDGVEPRPVSDLSTLPDGSVLVALPVERIIERHWPDDTITVFAGGGLGGDGRPAVEAALDEPTALAPAPDGSVYVGGACRVRRIRPDGLIETVAGSGACGAEGHGGPATAARLWPVSSIAVDPAGRLFIAQSGLDGSWQSRIQMVDVDGVIATLAGGLAGGDPGVSGQFAWEVPLSFPGDLTVGPDGLYFTEGDWQRQPPFGFAQRGTRHGIRRIDAQGRLYEVAGLGPSGAADDGTAALSAPLENPKHLAFSPEGRLHFVESVTVAGVPAPRLRRIHARGHLQTVAGGPDALAAVSRGSPQNPRYARLGFVDAIDFGPDGTLRLVDAPSILRLGPTVRGDLSVAWVRGVHAAFDGLGRHAATFDPLTGAPRLETRFDPAGRLAGLLDADGRLTRFERAPDGSLTGIVAPDGQRTIIALDAHGRLESLAAPGGRRVDLRWHEGGLLASATDAEGRTTRYTYDDEGRLAETQDPAGGGWQLTRPAQAEAQVVTWSSAMGRSSRSTRRLLADGTREDVERGPEGLADVGRRSPDGVRETRFADGTTLRVTPGLDPVDPLGGESFAQRVVFTLPSGRAVERLAERTAVLGRPGDPTSLVESVSTITVAGRDTTATWDAESRTATRVTAAGRVETLTLDEAGRVIETTSGALAPLRLQYDDEGRLVESSVADRRIRYHSDARDRLIERRDDAGQRVQYTYDDADRLETVVRSGPDDSTATLALAYDRTGLPTSVTPPGRPAHGLTHEPRGLLSGRTPPALPEDLRPDGLRLAYDLDAALVSAAENGEAPATLTYDDAGRPVRATVERGEATFAYDPDSGALQRTTSADGFTTVVERDGALLSARELYAPDGARLARVEVDTDVAGGLRPTAVRLVDASGAVSVVRPRFDDDGLLVGAGPLDLDRNGPDGVGLPVSVRVGALEIRRTYDAFGQLSDSTLTHDGAPLWSVSTTRDAVGRIATQTEVVLGEAREVAYAYDGLGRLASVVSAQGPPQSWLYDGNGARLVATGDPAGDVLTRHDDRDRLLAQGEVEFEHDSAGRRTARLDPAGGEWRYTYDRTGELLAVTGPAAGPVTYAYDAAGRRVERRVAGLVTDRFVHGSGGVPLARLDADGRLVQRYIGGSRTHVPDLMLMGERRLALVTDHLGSVRLVVDADTGEVAQRLDYDPWGRVLTDTRPGFQPFGFAGGLSDPDTGLVQMGGRHYDPETGRFLTPDRAGFGGGDPNLYAYAGNDPVNRIDPTGYAWEEDVASFASGLGNVLSFGLGGWLADELGVDDLVERCSRAYGAGEVTGAVADIVLPAGKLKALGNGWRLGRGVERGGEVLVKGGVGKTSVYRSVNAAGEVQYVGITNNLARRAAEHLRGSGIQIEKVMGGLSRSDARAVEQALIEVHGLGKNGGTLLNRINSIATTNPAYSQQLQRGYQLLRNLGYE